MAGLAPWVVGPARGHLIGLGDLVAGRRPEPAEQIFGLQIRSSLASLEVTETARRPDVGNIVGLDQTEDKIVFLLGLDGHQIHAVFATNVASIQPVELLVGQGGNVSGEEVVFTFVLKLLWACVEWAIEKNGSVIANCLEIGPQHDKFVTIFMGTRIINFTSQDNG